MVPVGDGITIKGVMVFTPVHVIRTYDCQSLMMAYSDFMGVPVAKSKELLQKILRQEWGFNGFIVSDCGAIGNLTARKHYTAKDKIEAANQALAAGIATNCGDTYSDKEVIAAARDGRINMENLDNVCRSMKHLGYIKGMEFIIYHTQTIIRVPTV